MKDNSNENINKEIKVIHNTPDNDNNIRHNEADLAHKN